MARRALLVVVSVMIAALLSVGLVAYYDFTDGTAKGDSLSNTYLTSCTVTGVGGFEFRVVSSSTGATIPLSDGPGPAYSTGAAIKAVDRLGCNGENQVVHLDSFSDSQGGGGWLVPDFPSQATPGGQLSFTIMYGGVPYNFTTHIPPIGTNCVTFQVPSDNMTSTMVMNGSGSYCS
jgi:hypothetical protein